MEEEWEMSRMKGKTKANVTPKKGQRVERARANEPMGGPTISEIMHMDVVKKTAVNFARQQGKAFKSEKERAIAAWAYANGVARTLKMAEKALGDFGASTVFGTIASAAKQLGGDDDDGCCDECRSSQPHADEFETMEKLLGAADGKSGKGKFDPMYL